ncbi:MAG: glycosyltransferase family 2 protein, partial [Thermoguttaceae bacterium]
MRFQAFLNPCEIVRSGNVNRVPTVSVVMPTFRRNREGFLAAAIDSVLGQTFRDFEFIIVDDGSTDGTEAVCRSYAARDPRIIYVRHAENCGLPAVRVNAAIMSARAPYVAFIFDDNAWSADVLETLVRRMEACRVDVVYSNMEIMLGGGKKCVLGSWPLSIELLMHLNTIPNGGVLCRQEFFQRYGMYDPHLILRRICDWDLWLRGLRLGATFSHCDKSTGREYGPASPVSLGNSVQWDYKT